MCSGETPLKGEAMLSPDRKDILFSAEGFQTKNSWTEISCAKPGLAISEHYRSHQQLAVIMLFQGLIYNPCIQIQSRVWEEFFQAATLKSKVLS